jgi:leader peptidase (prepilin peptidase)/N-methyltransferase
MGLILGSFFNVLIYRIPRNESIIKPPSHCPFCNNYLKIWENIPLISYIILKGRCSHCKNKISIQYPLVEILTAILCVFLYLFIIIPFLSSKHSIFEITFLILKLTILLITIPVSIIDLFYFIIPNCFTIPFLIIAFLFSFFPGDISPIQSLLGILIGAGILLLAGLIGEYILKKKESMGGGDIKLMAVFGALFGGQISFLTIFLASLIGSVLGLILLLLKKMPNEHKIPFGPFLSLGLWLSVLLYEKLILFYHSFIDFLINL